MEIKGLTWVWAGLFFSFFYSFFASFFDRPLDYFMIFIFFLIIQTAVENIIKKREENKE